MILYKTQIDISFLVLRIPENGMWRDSELFKFALILVCYAPRRLSCQSEICRCFNDV
jgi:hypothetical protein